MTEQKQDDQLEHTFSSFVRIWDVALKICQRRLTIGRSGERGSGISVLAARHDDDDDDFTSNILILVHRNKERFCIFADASFEMPICGNKDSSSASFVALLLIQLGTKMLPGSNAADSVDKCATLWNYLSSSTYPVAAGRKKGNIETWDNRQQDKNEQHSGEIKMSRHRPWIFFPCF